MIELPGPFVSEIKRLLPGDSDLFFSALKNEPVTSIRLNPLKPSGSFENQEITPWCPNGRILKERPSFITDPLFHAGAYYVQESSSMFLDEVMKQIRGRFHEPVKVLDLCASPGGKSTLILDTLNEDDLLVSNEIIRSRIQALEENLNRWGRANVFITNNDARDFAPLVNYFDILVVDAPCSGEGLFRKNKKAIDEWNPELVALCSSRQQRILSDILPALKPGGFLVYSTCTFNEKENEENAEWMMDEYGMMPVIIDITPNCGITPSGYNLKNTGDPYPGGYRFYPQKVKGEGLFITCLQKPKAQNSKYPMDKKRKPLKPVSRTVREELNQWLQAPQQFEFIGREKMLFALKQQHAMDYRLLSEHLRMVGSGITMGNIVNDKLIPHHGLALSVHLGGEVSKETVNREQALHYLKKDVLHFASVPTGWVLLTFDKLGLGWVKVLANRSNNYLPNHLRILKDISYE